MIIQEIWKPITDYEGLYEVSNKGRIRSLDRFDNRGVFRKGKILKPCYDGRGLYLHINLNKNGKSITKNVHRLVAMAFIENPLNLPEINHIDEDKENNCVENLEWCDHKYNNSYGSKSTRYKGSNNPNGRITEDIVRNIRKDRETMKFRELSEKYGLSETHLCAIIKGRKWGWVK